MDVRVKFENVADLDDVNVGFTQCPELSKAAGSQLRDVRSTV